jgi:ABC-2 type transport system permease protein
MLAIYTLWQRELVRFYRDRARLIGALAPPVLFWFLIGSGLGPSVLQYFFSGTLILIVLFTSVFSTISIIEDRREGFLQSVLIAPIPRSSLVAGKILGASTVGLLQGLTFLVFAQAAGFSPTAGGYALAVVTLFLASVGLTGLGFCIAWMLDSTQGFHAVMNLFLIPLWMLSGAMFPAATAPLWLKAVMAVNPVTYSVACLQQALDAAQSASLPSVEFCLLVLLLFAFSSLLASAWVAKR